MIPFSTSGSQDVTVDQGEAYILDLPPIQSYPSPIIQWFEITVSGTSPQSRSILAEAQRYHITLKNQLVRLETRIQDNGKTFKARAMNSYTGQISESQQYVLHVQSK